ncbi:MAG: NnrS family protein [Luteolibacter sp.]
MKTLGRHLDSCSAEPYRFFFPLGLLMAVIGVLLWPMYFSGWMKTWPLEMHTRMMIAGFTGCFIVGFLGTAGPRLLGTPTWFRLEFLWHSTMAVIAMAVLSWRKIHAADLLIGLWLTGVLLSLLVRAIGFRKNQPPPGFPIAVLGLLIGAASSIALGMELFLTFSFETRNLWRLLNFQAFPWLPILGVAPFLLPRFFGKSPIPTPTPRSWALMAGKTALATAIFLTGIVLESQGHFRLGTTLRLLSVGVFLLFHLPGWLGWKGKNPIAFALQSSILFGLLGWAATLAYPLFRTAGLHLMFIGGLSLIILAVAIRVIWSHGGRPDLLTGKLPWVHWVHGLILFTALTRFSADFMAHIRLSHYQYAAWLWVGVIGLWIWKLAAGFRKPNFQPLPRIRFSNTERRWPQRPA